MKKVLLLCMCTCIFAGAAMADLAKSWSNRHSTKPAAVQTNLQAELEAVQAELAAAKLNGEDESVLRAIALDLREKLGHKPVVISAPSGSSLDEGGETCATATAITGLPYADGGNTCDNSHDGDAGCFFNTGGDVFYSFSSAVDVTATLTTCHTATDYDTGLYILDSNGAEVACNDDAPGAPPECADNSSGFNRKSLIECFTFLAGESYCIVVTGFSDLCGNYLLTMEECAPPPCIECPPGAFYEDEPDCGPNYVDTYNGTCETALDLNCGTTVCGTTGAYNSDDGRFVRDSDFYRVVLTEPARLSFCVTTADQDDYVMDLTVHPSGCPLNTAFFYLESRNCVETCSTTHCLNPGEYIIQIGTNADCGTEYTFTVDCLPCEEPCNIVCPPDGIILDEAPCGPNFVDLTNGGCYGETPTFPYYTDISCGTTVCGNSGGELNSFDEDWFRIILTEPTVLTICVNSGADCVVPILDFVCPISPPAAIHVLEFFEPCEQTCQTTICLDAGEYFVGMVGFGVCGTPYTMNVTCSPCEPCDQASIDAYIGGPLPWCQCLYADCEGVTELCVGPLGPHEQPSSGIISPGCNGIPPRDGNENQEIPLEPCEDECPPAFFQLLAPEFIWDPVREVWCMPMLILEPGCLCFCLDDILPVELNSFTAVAGDGQVSLNWSTSSETDNDYFEIEREGTIIGRVEATNSPTGADYSFTEASLANGTEYTYTLVAVSMSGTREQISRVSATPSMSAATISEYALHQNYPNPFNPETNIVFDVVDAGNVTLTVYNPLGQTVATLVSGNVAAGRHTVNFDASSQPSGLYFYRLEAGDFSAVRKMILMK